MLVQSALLGAGSLDQRLVRALRSTSHGGAPLPGTRRSPSARRARRTDSARSRAPPRRGADHLDRRRVTRDGQGPEHEVADPPEWFGVIRPSRLLACTRRAGHAGHATRICAWSSTPIDVPEATTTTATTTGAGPRRARSSSCSRIRSSTRRALSDFLRKLFGKSRSAGDGARRRRDAGSVDSAGARRRAECPTSPHPDPLHE